MGGREVHRKDQRVEGDENPGPFRLLHSGSPVERQSRGRHGQQEDHHVSHGKHDEVGQGQRELGHEVM